MADQKQFNGTVTFNGSAALQGATTISGATTSTGAFHVNERYLEPIFTAATTWTTGGTLVKNTLNFINRTTDATFNMPAAATSTKGDVVVVKYINAVADGEAHVYDTDAAGFGVQSGVAVAQNATRGQVFAVVAPGDTTSDELTLSGATNGGIGVGSQLYFAFDGTTWYIQHAEIYQQGDGSINPTVAFS